ncbi:MAG: SDR family oxidoreductase [Acidimicrobiia bacterium]
MPTERDGTRSAHRVAIITGGSVGIGGAISRRLAEQGYAVSLSYLGSVVTAESAVDAIHSSRGLALAVRADVTDELDVERLFAETARAFVGIDVVVHAVALADGDVDPEVTSRRLRLRASRLVSWEASRRLHEGGALVNLCRVTDPTHTRAVAKLTRVLGRALRERDITVNAVASRFDDPDRCAVVVDTVAFLVGERGRGISGRVIRLDEPGHLPGVTPGATDAPGCEGRASSSDGGEHEHH